MQPMINCLQDFGDWYKSLDEVPPMKFSADGIRKNDGSDDDDEAPYDDNDDDICRVIYQKYMICEYGVFSERSLSHLLIRVDAFFAKRTTCYSNNFLN